MASEPIPEPLPNQEVTTGDEARLPTAARTGPELVQQAAPPIPAERELPRAPRAQEWEGTVRDKVADAKQAASRAKEATAQAIHDAKEQASAAVAQARDRAADIYRDSRIRTNEVLRRTRSRINYLMDEHPLEVIAGVAAVAVVCGVLLRVWRSSRDA